MKLFFITYCKTYLEIGNTQKKNRTNGRGKKAMTSDYNCGFSSDDGQTVALYIKAPIKQDYNCAALIFFDENLYK